MVDLHIAAEVGTVELVAPVVDSAAEDNIAAVVDNTAVGDVLAAHVEHVADDGY